MSGCLGHVTGNSQADGFSREGVASWYGQDFHGRETASGEVYDMYAFTAAHASLPFGTHLRVTNVENGRTVDVRINDRFPGTKGRAIDLSMASFEKIAPLHQGLARVRLEILQQPEPR